MQKINLNRMLWLVSIYFADEYDKGGNPYALHCIRVMQNLNSQDEELQCIALGHDLIEDTEVSANYLRDHGFSERVVRGIVALTKIKGEDYETYKSRVKSNPDAIRVKIADLKDNSDITRLKGVSEKDFERMKKYHQFYVELQELVKSTS